MYYSEVISPIGTLLLAGTRDVLHGLYFSTGSKARGPAVEWERYDEPFRRAKNQLQAYFAGELKRFDLELAPDGTDFQRSVLDALLNIPYGETRTYTEVAELVGRPRAVRAVGAANGRNLGVGPRLAIGNIQERIQH